VLASISSSGARTSLLPLLGFAVLLWFASVAGCDCRGETANTIPIEHECDNDADCIALYDIRWYCDASEEQPERRVCHLGPRFCEDEGDAECCPGQTCNRAGVCQDRYDTCNDDADCGVAGQRCLTRFVNGSDQEVCTFELCEDGACAEGLHCFAGWCVGENPCRGGCPAGQACVPSNNQCHPAPMCEGSCPDGSIMTFTDPDNLDDACDIDSLECGCEPLPPLRIRDIGRHSGLARTADGTLAVSAYSGDYGDLVVVYFDGSGQRTGTEWVDGVPSGATVVANPAGPRGGVSEPGPDVGRHTSIAAAGDTLHISYYDRTEGRLKYARRSGGAWTHHVVDEEGDAGRYTSIAVDGSGVPTIAYFRRRGVDDEVFVTALKVARATSTSPSGPDDWNVVVVDTGAVPPPPCDGGCGDGESCVDDGAGASCHTTVGGCGGCADGQRCVDLGEGPVCRDRVATAALDDLPMGVGLFPALVLAADGTASIAYYDRLNADLRLAVGVDPAADEAGTVMVADGGPTEDLGQFTAMVADGNGDLLIAYQDAVNDQLRWLHVTADGTPIDSGIVDDGVRDALLDGDSMVGVDNAVAIAADGRWLVAYQNATAGTLVLAVRNGDDWDRQTLASEGAAGFWADALFAGGQLYVSHATIQGQRSRPMRTDLTVEVVSP
jgi:hypothetical protein